MLQLENNQITSIQGYVFSALTNLNSLNLEYNKIKNISDNAFRGLESKHKSVYVFINELKSKIFFVYTCHV